MLLVEHGDEVAGLRLVQGDPLVIQLLLLHLHQVGAPETVNNEPPINLASRVAI